MTMEAKIKKGDEFIEATIEIIDGAIVVLPKNVKYEPKDGDVVCVDSLSPCVGIVREVYSYGKPDTDRLHFSVGYWKRSGYIELKLFCACNRNTQPNYRLATKEEKQKLFDKLAEKGFAWDAEKKKLVKLKWEPEVGQVFWTPLLDPVRLFEPFDLTWREQREHLAILKRDWVFKSKEECQGFCDKLNKAINQVKP